MLLNPAISPIYGQNPGFRVVSYRNYGTVTDQTTYYLTNLTSASSTTKGKWKQEYTVTHQDEKKVVRALYCGDEGLSVEDYRACYCGTQVSH